jgi:hypothetical protein
VKATRVPRGVLAQQPLDGALLARDLRDGAGRIAFHKGKALGEGDRDALCALSWDELHLVHLEQGDVHEDAAGERLARAAAGEGTAVGALGGGHWPIRSTHRGILAVRVDALADVNAVEGLGVYTLYDGQVVEAGEVVARAKIHPFAIARERIELAERLAGATGGLVLVRPFLARRVGVVVQESLGATALARFREAIGEKVAWFGATLLPPAPATPNANAVAAALDELLASGAELLVVAGSRPMDPLEPAYDALDIAGATFIRRGVPAHPGSLFWLAELRGVAVLGMPSCGLFSQATIFDLILPRLLAGESVGARELAALGHGGFLTRDMAFRFPPYRPARERGEVE